MLPCANKSSGAFLERNGSPAAPLFNYFFSLLSREKEAKYFFLFLGSIYSRNQSSVREREIKRRKTTSLSLYCCRVSDIYTPDDVIT